MPYKLSNPDPAGHGLINCLVGGAIIAVPAGGSVVTDSREVAEKFLGDYAARGVKVEEVTPKQVAAADAKQEKADAAAEKAQDKADAKADKDAKRGGGR